MQEGEVDVALEVGGEPGFEGGGFFYTFYIYIFLAFLDR